MTDLEQLRHRAQLIEQLLEARHQRATKTFKYPDTWRQQARPNQLEPPGDWHIWLTMAGRGFGKTKGGSEWIAEKGATNPKTAWAVVGPTWRDTEEVPIAEIIKVLTAYKIEHSFNVSKLKISLFNGSTIMGYTAEKPDRLRGPNFSGAWCDELAAYPNLDYLWNECLVPAVRIGEHPRIHITTTPKPRPLIKDLRDRRDGSVVLVRGSTFDNEKNLSPAVLAELRKRYEGTRMGRQELYGELLDDAENALWDTDLVEAAHAKKPLPALMRTIVSVDPSGSADGDATGIVTCAVDAAGVVWVLADDTCNGSPGTRYERVCVAANRHGAGTILYEGAYGGDNIAHGIQMAWKDAVARKIVEGPCPLLKVSPTKSSKADRAHPVVALYEQTKNGFTRVQHVRPFPELEDEMVQWEPDAGWSPNRMDALVHGVRFLAPVRESLTYSSMLSMPPLPSIGIS